MSMLIPRTFFISPLLALAGLFRFYKLPPHPATYVLAFCRHLNLKNKTRTKTAVQGVNTTTLCLASLPSILATSSSRGLALFAAAYTAYATAFR